MIQALLQRRPALPRVVASALTLLVAATMAACGAESPSGNSTSPVVAAENFWGSIASQVAGSSLQVTSILTSPDADPHSYEAKPKDAKLVASAKLVIYNGAGYDPWMDKLLKSNPSSNRTVLNVADMLGKKEGDNPHFWYSPEYVTKTIGEITSDLKKVDGTDASSIDQRSSQFQSDSLKTYSDLISSIKQKYAGTPVGATESIFEYLSTALGLKLLTPAGYLKAISEGTDPTPADKAMVDQQVTQKQIKVFVFNSQNSTPDVKATVDKARAKNIPIVAITETLSPAGASFQDWQVKQLTALQQALAGASS